MSINTTHVWALWNHCVCLVIIIRECFRNLNWSLQLEHTELGLKRKLKKEEAWQKMSPGSFYSSTKLSSRKKKKKINENSSGKRQSTHFLGDLFILGISCLTTWYVKEREIPAFLCLAVPFFHFVMLPSTRFLVIYSMIPTRDTKNRKQNSVDFESILRSELRNISPIP